MRDALPNLRLREGSGTVSLMKAIVLSSLRQRASASVWLRFLLGAVGVLAAYELIKRNYELSSWIFTAIAPWPFVFMAFLPELVIPERPQTWFQRLRGLPWRMLDHVWAITGVVLIQGWVTAHTPWKPMFHLDFTQPGISLPLMLISPFAAIFFVDCLYYWFHRAQHRYAWLWRLHSVHHAIRDLNALNIYHHWTERLLWVPLLFTPMSYFIEVTAPHVLGVTLFVHFYSFSIHSNARLRYGPFKYFLTEPRFHRIHHSLEDRHQNHNFCAFFPFLDMIFGTAYFPAKGEYPDIGLKHQAEVRTLGDYIFARGDRIEPGESSA
jgi:sterol desaturase/sphingolipid hydroxylase (fatty acid hydroxylase superfamily)